MVESKKIGIHTEYIQLDQVLKLAGIVGSGGEAKTLIQEGNVSVNGETERRRGRKLHPGDIVKIWDISITVETEIESRSS